MVLRQLSILDPKVEINSTTKMLLQNYCQLKHFHKDIVWSCSQFFRIRFVAFNLKLTEIRWRVNFQCSEKLNSQTIIEALIFYGPVFFAFPLSKFSYSWCNIVSSYNQDISEDVSILQNMRRKFLLPERGIRGELSDSVEFSKFVRKMYSIIRERP